MKFLSSQKILLGVTGSIAAYKAAELVRLILKEGGEVRVVLTEAAARFISPLTFETLSGRPAWTDPFLDPLAHIELGRWADKIVIAPATADFLAKMRSGLADDLLSTLVLAASRPILVAPAMNRQMWEAPATQENIGILRKRGVFVLGPDWGEQACGEVGPGRMVEPQEMLLWLPLTWSHELEGVRVLITAGPTREPFDPVRFLSNRSSGKMGYALARAARARGAQVTLISGPTALAPPWGVETIWVERAEEMAEAVQEELKKTEIDILIAAAAVADYRPDKVSSEKIKKGRKNWSVLFQPNPDILQSVVEDPQRPRLVVGFAAETGEILEHARNKWQRKRLDAIVANSVGRAFEQDENEVWWLTASEERHFEKQPKVLLADRLMELMAGLYRERCARSS